MLPQWASNENLKIPFTFHTIGNLIAKSWDINTHVCLVYQQCNDLTEIAIQHVYNKYHTPGPVHVM